MREPTVYVTDPGLGHIDQPLGDAGGKRQVAHQDEERDGEQNEVVDALPHGGGQRGDGNGRGRKHQPHERGTDQRDGDRNPQRE